MHAVTVTPEDVQQFQEVVRREGRRGWRSMRWRETPSPYYVYLSEMMLQQTQVARVIPAFAAFLERFPDLHTLASATQADVVAQWAGLGYNRRARYLHQGAGIICHRWNGVIPDDPAALVSLPGVGKNTAGALCAYAFNRRVAFIETNIRRVFIHHFFAPPGELVVPPEDPIHDREIMPLVEATLPHHDIRQWYWALMDYGTALSRTGENPNRRSRHYTRQSQFRGSTREVRGALVRTLIAEGTLAAEAIPDYRGFPAEQIARAVDGLVNDGVAVRRADGSLELLR